MTADGATEQLVRAHEYTDEHGYATAEVVDEPYVEAGRIRVPIEVLTTGDRHTITFDPPATWSEEYPIVRLVESVGYGPGGLAVLDGERFPVELDGPSSDTTPQPVFDAADQQLSNPTVAGAEIPEFSRETVARGAMEALRLAGRSAQYAVAVVTFLAVVTVGTVVAATVTYATVLSGFLALSALTLAGGSGPIGALLPVLATLVAIRVVVSRRIRSGLPDETAGGSRGTRPTLDRYR